MKVEDDSDSEIDDSVGSSESDEEMPDFENELERELYTSRKHEETKRKQERDRVKQRMKEQTQSISQDRSRSPSSRQRKSRPKVDQEIAMSELKSARERKSEVICLIFFIFTLNSPNHRSDPEQRSCNSFRF